MSAAWCALAWLLAASSAWSADKAAYITTLKDYFGGPFEPEGSSRPVRILATATYVDPEWKILFVQDDTGGSRIYSPARRLSIAAGDQVLIEGTRPPRTATNAIHEVRDVTLRRVGRASLPKAAVADSGELTTRSFDGRLVEVHGTVRSVMEVGRLHLVALVDGVRLAIWVRAHQPSDLSRLLDAQVTFQGVCSQDVGADGKITASLFVAEFKSLRVTRPGPEDPYAMEKTPIGRMLAGQVDATGEKRVKVEGTVLRQDLKNSVLVEDETGRVTLRTPQRTPLAKGDHIGAIGFPVRAQGEIVLEDSQFRLTQATSVTNVLAAQADPNLPVLTSIKQVLELTREQARRGYPVKVTGVVTHFDAQWKQLFIQDGDQAIYVDVGNQTVNLRTGQRLEVSGVTVPGGVLTMISPAKLEVQGEAVMPAAAAMTYHLGMTGVYDACRVKVKGTVQAVVAEENHLILDLMATDGRFDCTLPEAAGSSLRSRLVNAVVEVEGVCVLNLDALGSPSGVTVAIDHERDLTILEKAPEDEFNIPTRRIGDLFRFLHPNIASRRLKVRGAVTLWRPGRELYLQDETGAIRALSTQTNSLAPGDEVELIGYRTQGEGVPILQNTEFHPVGKGRALDPRSLRPAEVLSITNQGRLLQMVGRLVEDAYPSAAPELLLEQDQVLFIAAIEPLEPGRLSPAWRKGSLLRVTGVCHLRVDESQRPRAVRLLARSPTDVEVLENPPWLTRGRVLTISIVLLITVILALGWNAALRRRVSKQTEFIRQRLESEVAMERRLALVWENSADGMRMTDREGVVVQVNSAYCRMVRKRREELKGLAFVVPYQTEGQEAQLAKYREGFARRDIATRLESELVLWDGHKVWFELANAFFEEPGSPPLLLSQFRDITDRKRAEEEKQKLVAQLLQAQKMESVGRLAGGVAHDFNNMLQVILGNTTLALEDVSPASKLHEDLLEIQKSALRSAELTRQLLAFARKQTIHPEILDLNDKVAGMLKMLQRLIGENIQLLWLPDVNLRPVRVDPAQIDQILVNLSVNARDAIAETGQITIETSNASFDDAYARLHPDCAPGDYVVLAVGDTGHGMDSATREHLFEPFFTTKEVGKGTGLGLATVYGIVKQNQGFITVRSEPNQGTTFEIHLPRVEVALNALSNTDPESSRRGDETILLVEDEEQILNLGCRILTKYGYRVLTAQDPGGAVELVKRHAGQIHLLITDVIMPAMNGKELKHQIEALQPGIHCLFMSGYTADVIAHHGVLEEGINYLQKPFTVQTLTGKVRRVIEGKG